jgi:hypothetical protein
MKAPRSARERMRGRRGRRGCSEDRFCVAGTNGTRTGEQCKNGQKKGGHDRSYLRRKGVANSNPNKLHVTCDWYAEIPRLLNGVMSEVLDQRAACDVPASRTPVFGRGSPNFMGDRRDFRNIALGSSPARAIRPSWDVCCIQCLYHRHEYCVRQFALRVLLIEYGKTGTRARVARSTGPLPSQAFSRNMTT